MPAKKNAELTKWKKKQEELKAQMPLNEKGKPLDARAFKGCMKDDGTLDDNLLAKVCEKRGCPEKVAAVKAFLTMETKPTVVKRDENGGGSMKSAGKRKGKIDLFAQETYSDLKYDDVKKIIAMLSDVLIGKKAEKKAELENVISNAKKGLKDLDEE